MRRARKRTCGEGGGVRRAVKPRYRAAASRRARMIPLLGRWALQLIEDQLTMLPEFVETSFERLER
jgi:hypothetical protein